VLALGVGAGVAPREKPVLGAAVVPTVAVVGAAENAKEEAGAAEEAPVNEKPWALL
jgi:hypothetical protein